MICKGCGKEYIPRHKRDYRCQTCYSKMGKRAKHKGYTDEKRFERWLQNKIDKYGLGYSVHRTPRSGGIKEFNVSDFFFKRLPPYSIFNNIHLEKKDRDNWNIIEWIKEGEEKEKELGNNKQVVIIARKPHDTEDYIIMKKELFADIILQLEKLTQEHESAQET